MKPVTQPGAAKPDHKRAFSHPVQPKEAYGAADLAKKGILVKAPKFPWRCLSDYDPKTDHLFLDPQDVTLLQMHKVFGGSENFFDEGFNRNEPNPVAAHWVRTSLSVDEQSRGKPVAERIKRLAELGANIPGIRQVYLALNTYHEKTGIWFLGTDPARYTMVEERSSVMPPIRRSRSTGVTISLGKAHPHFHIGGGYGTSGPSVARHGRGGLLPDYDGVVIIREYLPSRLAAPAKK